MDHLLDFQLNMARIIGLSRGHRNAERERVTPALRQPMGARRMAERCGQRGVHGRSAPNVITWAVIGRIAVSERDREKWNARYRDGAYAGRAHPAELLAQWAPQVLAWHSRAEPRAPRALDVACGAGRNAVWLAAAGFRVDAVDIAEAGLAVGRARAAAAGVAVTWHGLDLDDDLPAALTGYDLMAVIRYLNRPLLQALPARLRAGGLLVCEVHLETTAAVVGPGAGLFRAAPGELAGLLAGLEVLTVAEGLVTDPDGRTAAVARFVGRRPPG